MSIHIKQLKGANDLIERDEFVKNNLIGKMKLKDGNLMLSVPLKIEKTVEDMASDFSMLNENDFVTKEYVDTSISALKGDVSANYDTLKEIEDNIKSISAATGVDPVSAESKSSKGTEIGSISIGDNTVTFYIDLSNYVEKSGENAAFTTVPTAPSISSAYDDNKLVTASFVHEVERKLIGAIDDDTIEVLTTLSDISAAINNDPEYYSTVQDALNAKLNKSDISIIPESGIGTPIGKIILDEDTYEFKVDLSALDFFNSPNFTGEPTVPDVAQGDSSSLVANTRFVTTAVSNAVSSVKGEPPDNLNTLQKISTAIGNDSAFAANVNSSLSTIDSTVSDLNIAVSSAAESIESVNNNKQPLSNALTSISSLPTEADRMIYTTAKDTYAVTTLTGSARTLISKTDEQGMREYLSVPKADGTGASGSWNITADKALKDKDGNPIDTTYLKTDAAVNVSVSNLVTGTDVTRLGTITIGDKSHDINVDLSSYAPLNNATLTGAPAAPSPTLTDSSTRIATTGFVQSVVSGAIDDLVGEGTPEALNTLKEIADIIGSDADFTGSIITELGKKVSKEEGKGLSTNDFTTEEKNKLSGIEAGANNYSLPTATTTIKGGVIVGTGLSVKDGKVSLTTATNDTIGGIKLGNGVTTTTGGVVSIQSATADQNGLMTKEQVSKLNSIAADAEVNVINRVKVNDTVLPISDKTVTINLTDYVQKDGTKVLSDNNYTTEEKSKLAGIEAGAQVNKIDAIKVNGTFVEPDSDKAINITVSGGGDYILPDATTTDKGGIIVGNGLVVNNATVSVATATTDKIGGIRLGNGVTTTTGGIVSIQSATSGQNGLMTSDQASKLAGITAGAEVNTINIVKVNGTSLTPDINKVVDITVPDISDKVDKVDGKGLSTNDFTSSYKDKLDNIADGAEVNIINAVKVNDMTLPVSDKTVTIDLTNYVQKDGSKILSTNDFTKSYKDKLDSIADNATKDNVSIIAGTVNSTINTAVTSDPYINLTDNNVKKGSVRIKGDGAVSVSSDSSGVITIKSTNTTYSAGTGISLTGTNNTIISADAGYLGSVAKGTDTTKFLNSKGEWAVPPNTDTNTTYSAGNGLSLSTTTFSVKVPTDSGLSVTDKGVSLTAAQTNVIGGVKVAAVNTSNISLGSDGSISVPAASSSQAGVVKLGGGTTNYLRADGSWAAPTGTTYSVATTTSNGLLSSTDKTKLDSVSSSALTDVSVSGKTMTFTNGSGDTVTVQTQDTTYNTVTSSADGLVPKLPGGTAKYLRADGQWSVPPDTTYTAGTGISIDSENKINVKAATSSAIGGVKVATITSSNVSLQADGSISVPLASSLQAGVIKLSGKTDEYLKSDGSWGKPAGTAYSDATSAESGLLSSTDKTKLDSVTSSAFTGVSVDGTNVTFTKGDGSIVKIQTANTTYGTVTSATSGLVPTLTNNSNQYLRADGSWATPPDTNTTYSAGTGISLTGTTFKAHPDYIGDVKKDTTDTGSGKFLKADGTWAVPPDTNTTYSAGTGISLSGTTLKADPNYLGSVQKGTGTTAYLRADGTWATPAGTSYGTVTSSDAGLVPALAGGTSKYLRADGTWNTPPDTNTTYSGSNGISISGTVISADSDYIGSVKKDATSGSSGKFLKADGTWATPPDTNSTYSAGNGLQLSSGAFSVKVPSNSGLSVTTNGVSVTAATTSAIGGVKVATVSTSNISLASDGGISVPLATTSQAGAIKIGTNLSVNNGTISLSSSNVTGALGFTPANSADVPAAATVMTGASASAAGKAGLVPAPANGNQDKFLKGDGTWATPPDTNTTYSGSGGINVSGTVISANSSYLGSIAKGTDTTKFLNSKGEWAVPPDTNTTYSAGNGLAVSSNSFSVKVPSNSGLSVTSNGVSVTAATGSAIGGVKIGEGISTGTGGVISIPTATTSNNGLMTTAQVNSLAAVADATKNNVSLTAGASKGTANAAVTSPYINLTDNDSNKGSIQLKSEGAVTISSNAAGVITIKSTDTNTTYSAGTGLSLSGTTFSANSNYLGSIQKGTNTTTFLNNKGEWATPPNDNTTYSGSNGISVSGTVISANSNYLGSIQKSTGTTNFLRADGTWAVPPGTVTNTDAKVAQNVSTTDNTFPILLAATANATVNVAATNVIFGKGVKVNPSKSVITAATFDGIATKASLDSAGNQISTTYAPLANPVFTGTVKASTIQFQDEVYAANAGAVSLDNNSSDTTSIQALDGFTSLPSGLYTMRYKPSSNHWCNVISTRQRGGIGKMHASYGMQIISDMISESDLYWRQQTNSTLWSDVKTIVDSSNLATQLKNIDSPEFTGTVKATNISLSNPLPIPHGGTGTNNLANITVGAATKDGSGKTITTTYAPLANPTFTGTVKAPNVSLSGAATIPTVTVTTKLTAAAITGGAVHTTTTAGDLGWENKATDGLQIITKNSLAYWNGQYKSGLSNLLYCSLGAFGTAATTDARIYPSLASENTFTAQINLGNETAPGYLRVPKYGSVGLGSKGANYNGLMMLEHQADHTSKSDVLLKSTQNLFLASGNQFFTAYGIDSVTSSINSAATTENIYLISDNAIHFWTGFKSSTKSAMSLSSSGILTVPQIQLSSEGCKFVRLTNNYAVKYASSANATISGYISRDHTISSAANTDMVIHNTGRLFIFNGEQPYESFGNLCNDIVAYDYTGNYSPIYLMPSGSFSNLDEARESIDGGVTSGGSSTEHMYVASDRSIIFYTNLQTAIAASNSLRAGTVPTYNVKQYNFAMTYTGYFEAPKIRTGSLQLTEPLAIKYGGTGGTNQTEALAGLGISTVSSDIAIQAMGLGNGTGCYTCNISLTNNTLANDSLSPMTGFTLKDGVTVYFYHPGSTNSTNAMFSFNGCTAHSARTVNGSLASYFKPNVAAGYYKAIYHTSSLGVGDSSIPACTWLVFNVS